MSLFDWLFENKGGDAACTASSACIRSATNGKSRSIDALLDEYGSARNWTEQYNILAKAATLANQKLEKLQVIAKIYQFKRDHGL